MIKNLVLGLSILLLSCTEAHEHALAVPRQNTKPIKEEIKRYYTVRDSLGNARKALALKYKKCLTEDAKTAVLKKAGDLFVSGITEKLFPYWYGTPWAYYGYGDTPRVNEIACGYFVATLLRDMGAKVNIHNFAEGPSGDMIKDVTTKAYIKRYRSVPAADFFRKVKADGDGLYIIGLDYHTGFLLCERGKLFFIDSSWEGVHRHDPGDSVWLVNSNYRMTGKISDDPSFIKKWLTGEEFPSVAWQ